MRKRKGQTKKLKSIGFNFRSGSKEIFTFSQKVRKSAITLQKKECKNSKILFLSIVRNRKIDFSNSKELWVAALF